MIQVFCWRSVSLLQRTLKQVYNPKLYKVKKEKQLSSHFRDIIELQFVELGLEKF